MCAGFGGLFGGLGLAARIRAPRLPRRPRRLSSSAWRARERRTLGERSGAHRPVMRLGPQLPTCIAAGGAGSSGDSLEVEGKRGVLRARCCVGWFSRAKGSNSFCWSVTSKLAFRLRFVFAARRGQRGKTTQPCRRQCWRSCPRAWKRSSLSPLSISGDAQDSRSPSLPSGTVPLPSQSFVWCADAATCLAARTLRPRGAQTSRSRQTWTWTRWLRVTSTAFSALAVQARSSCARTRASLRSSSVTPPRTRRSPPFARRRQC